MPIGIFIGNAIGGGGPSGLAPSNTIAPVVSGSGVIGQTLTTTNGTWTGDSPITYTYQWQRNGSPISGATSSTYLLVYADRGANVRCVVTATNTIGSASANSNAIAVASFDADYQAILDKASSVGFGYTLPTDSVKVKQNTLLTSMKADGVWAKLDVFYVFAQDGSAQFGTLNWKNPNANQAALVNVLTFVSNGGLQGNGIDSYIDTNFNPATQGVQYTLNNASRYFFTHAISGSGRFDGNSLSGINSMLRASTNQHRINAGSSNLLATAFDFNSTVNTKSIHRTSSTNVTLYNSTTGSSTTQTSTSIQSSNQWILASSSLRAAHTCAAYAMGASMIAEHTNFITDWNTYKNSL
jgi:hypothetical protein